VQGNLNATEKVDIKDSGSVEGDIVAPRVAIAEWIALPRQHRHAEEGPADRGGGPAARRYKADSKKSETQSRRRRSRSRRS